jgi:hypothetical protein
MAFLKLTPPIFPLLLLVVVDLSFLIKLNESRRIQNSTASSNYHTTTAAAAAAEDEFTIILTYPYRLTTASNPIANASLQQQQAVNRRARFKGSLAGKRPHLALFHPSRKKLNVAYLLDNMLNNSRSVREYENSSRVSMVVLNSTTTIIANSSSSSNNVTRVLSQNLTITTSELAATTTTTTTIISPYDNILNRFTAKNFSIFNFTRFDDSLGFYLNIGKFY